MSMLMCHREHVLPCQCRTSGPFAFFFPALPPLFHCLDGIVVKASASGAEDPGSNLSCAGIFPGSSHTSDLKIGTPVATLTGAWHYRVSAGTGRPGFIFCDWVRYKV